MLCERAATLRLPPKLDGVEATNRGQIMGEVGEASSTGPASHCLIIDACSIVRPVLNRTIRQPLRTQLASLSFLKQSQVRNVCSQIFKSAEVDRTPCRTTRTRPRRATTSRSTRLTRSTSGPSELGRRSHAPSGESLLSSASLVERQSCRAPPRARRGAPSTRSSSFGRT